MNLFCRKYEKIGYGNKISEQNEKEFNRVKELKLGRKDIVALVVAAFQIIMPFAIGVAAIYFLIILFITKVWMA